MASVLVVPIQMMGHHVGLVLPMQDATDEAERRPTERWKSWILHPTNCLIHVWLSDQHIVYHTAYRIMTIGWYMLQCECVHVNIPVFFHP